MPPSPSALIAMVPQRYEAAVPLAKLTPHPANPNDGDAGLVAELMEANGWVGAVLAQESTGILMDGETRWRTAAAEGLAEIPVLWADVDDDTRDRFLASLNESTRRGMNNMGKLVALLQGLAPTPKGLAGAAFDGDDLDAMVRQLAGPVPGGGDPDATPPVPDDPVTAHGDLWLLGPHRLLCGDARSPADLARLLEGLGAPGIVCTDPPYGSRCQHRDGAVGGGGTVHAGMRNAGAHLRAATYRPVTGDRTTKTAAAAFRQLAAAYPAAAHVWWGGNHYAGSAGLPDSSCWLVWDKENAGSDFADCELAWTNHRGAVRVFRHMWNGIARDSEQGRRFHPTQKPVALAVWAFGVVDPKAERGLVLDPFAGSGPALIAAHRTGRVAALMEIEPGYVDVIATRWEADTGIKPERVAPTAPPSRSLFLAVA